MPLGTARAPRSAPPDGDTRRRDRGSPRDSPARSAALATARAARPRTAGAPRARGRASRAPTDTSDAPRDPRGRRRRLPGTCWRAGTLRRAARMRSTTGPVGPVVEDLRDVRIRPPGAYGLTVMSCETVFVRPLASVTVSWIVKPEVTPTTYVCVVVGELPPIRVVPSPKFQK